MPSYDELDEEACWREEIQPPSLVKLGADLRAHFGWGASAIGIRGDNKHLRGYHRSRRWIAESRYCTNRSYSVSETTGNRAGGDKNWCCAIDVIPATVEQMLTICRRLDAAVRAGRLEKVTEWYGNVDGDDRVDGYNNIANAIASSDSSHLWHLHMSFDRGRANEDHSDVLAILIGEAMALKDDDDFRVLINRGKSIIEMSDINPIGSSLKPEPNQLARAIRALAADLKSVRELVAGLAARPAVDVDEQALAAALAPLIERGATPSEVAAAVRAEIDKTRLGASPTT